MVHYPLVRLPQQIDEVLYMILQDLKSQKYFDGQAELNGSDSPYRPFLCKVILVRMNLDDGSDEIFELYDQLILKRSQKIGDDTTSQMKQVMKVYAALLMEKERRKANIN
jgi:hypothetical protein